MACNCGNMNCGCAKSGISWAPNQFQNIRNSVSVFDRASRGGYDRFNDPIRHIKTQRDWLRFKDFKHFEATIQSLDHKGREFIDEFEFSNKLNTLRQLYKSNGTDETAIDTENDNDESRIDFEPLVAVLNSKGIVEIGNFIYKVEYPSRLIIIPSNEESVIGEIERGSLVNGRAMYLYFNNNNSQELDDRIEFEEGNSQNTIGLRIGCGAGRCPLGIHSNSQNSGEYKALYNGASMLHRFRGIATYGNVGIYKWIKFTVKHQRKNILRKATPTPAFYIYAEGSYKPRCRTRVHLPYLVTQNGLTYTNPLIIRNSLFNSLGEVTISIYGGARGLSSFSITNIQLGGQRVDNNVAYLVAEPEDLSCST